MYREGESLLVITLISRVDQQRSLKSQLSDQINIATRRCAVQEQAAARWRILRAEIALQESRVANLKQRLAVRISYSTKQVPRSTTKVSALSATSKRIAQIQTQQLIVNHRTAAARQVLVREASAVMGLEKSKIAGLPLISAGEMKRKFIINLAETKVQNAIRINASLLHTCHILDLFTRYLFIALPFEPSGGRIKSNLPFVASTKFRDKNTLTLTRKHQRAFYTSYALLLHSVAYLAWTQGIEEGDLATNLYSIAHGRAVGRKSHLGMRSLGFSLDVHDVVEQVLEESGFEEEGWALVN